VPVIVTDAPTAPEIGDKLLIVGDAALAAKGAKRMAREIRDEGNKEVTRAKRFI
jgi:hypothetical protein